MTWHRMSNDSLMMHSLIMIIFPLDYQGNAIIIQFRKRWTKWGSLLIRISSQKLFFHSPAVVAETNTWCDMHGLHPTWFLSQALVVKCIKNTMDINSETTHIYVNSFWHSDRLFFSTSNTVKHQQADIITNRTNVLLWTSTTL